MMKWEYLRHDHPALRDREYLDGWRPLDQTLNEYGAQGWELVSIVESDRNSRLTFKRPVAALGWAIGVGGAGGSSGAIAEVDLASLPDAALERIVSGAVVDTEALRARIADAVTEGARDGAARRALLDAVTGRLRGIALQLPGMSAARRQLNELLSEIGAP